MDDERSDVLQGTLDLLVLRTLEALGPMHGWGIAQRIREVSDEVLRLNTGSLYPALQRARRRGWIRARWGETENRRRARYYELTASGRDRLATERRSWERMSLAITRVLESS